MKRSAFERTSEIAAAVAPGYELRGGALDGTVPEREHAGRGYNVPNGALYTTVGDLAKFLSFELGHGPPDVLSTEARTQNYARLLSASGTLDSGYGIGFQATRRGAVVAIGHGGSVAVSVAGLALRALEIVADSRPAPGR